MKIPREQLSILEAQGRVRFEEELVVHLREFAPKHCLVIGDAQLRLVVSAGVDRCATHGFTKRGPIRFFLEMMFMFGSGFDTDPQLPWVLPCLGDQTMDELSRADRMHDGTMEYLRLVAGPERMYAMQALRRLQHVRLEDIGESEPDLDARMLRELATVFPQKCKYLGDATIRNVIRSGRLLAASHGVGHSGQWTALFIALTFSLGHRFSTDPLFPWIIATLDSRAGLDSEARAAKLYSRSRAYLDRAISYLETH